MTHAHAAAPAASSVDGSAARTERLARLRAYLAEDRASGALISRPEHLRYLAGWSGDGGPATLVLADDAYLVAPAGSHDAAVLDRLGIEAVPYVVYDRQRLVDPVASWRAAVLDIVGRVGLRGRVGAEPDRLPASIAAAIQAFTPVDVGRPLALWRRIKDPVEQTAIRRSVAAVDHGFGAIRDAIRPGIRELDLFATLERAITEATGSPVRLDSNLGSGSRSALEDPHQSERSLEAGDVVLVDLYPAIDGYVADLTRTFIVGRATSEQRKRHAALESALALGVAALGPGVPAREIDRIVRDELERLMPGLARSMTHHTGHGIGLEPWEDPWIGQQSDLELEAGMVVALEPGLYLAGIEGMRLEGNFLVGVDGAERLDISPSELVECGV